jgi:hypothetical protein
VAIKIQILLCKNWRTPEGVAAVRKIAASLGIKETVTGVATVSGEIDHEAFASLFGHAPQDLNLQPPGQPGTFAGRDSEGLSIPNPLREYVESITIAPPHIHLNNPEDGSVG